MVVLGTGICFDNKKRSVKLKLLKKGMNNEPNNGPTKPTNRTVEKRKWPKHEQYWIFTIPFNVLFQQNIPMVNKE